MLFAPVPQLAAAVLGPNGFTASFGAHVDHDAAPEVLGALRSFAAQGPVSLTGGNRSGAPGSAGGLFDITASGPDILIGFDRNGLGQGFAEGDQVTTELPVPVSDTQTTVTARIRVTVIRPYRLPVMAGPVPDQTDMVVVAPVLERSIPDQMSGGPGAPALAVPLPDRSSASLAGPGLVTPIPDQSTGSPAAPVLLAPLPDQTDPQS